MPVKQGQIGVGGHEAFEALGDRVGGVVDQLLGRHLDLAVAGRGTKDKSCVIKQH